VIEHASGFLAAGAEDPVDNIWIADDYGQMVYLPVHFASREMGYEDGLGRHYQFGSPIRMYLPAGRKITIYGDAPRTRHIKAIVIGHLIPL